MEEDEEAEHDVRTMSLLGLRLICVMLSSQKNSGSISKSGESDNDTNKKEFILDHVQTGIKECSRRVE